MKREGGRIGMPVATQNGQPPEHDAAQYNALRENPYIRCECYTGEGD